MVQRAQSALEKKAGPAGGVATAGLIDLLPPAVRQWLSASPDRLPPAGRPAPLSSNW